MLKYVKHIQLNEFDYVLSDYTHVKFILTRLFKQLNGFNLFKYKTYLYQIQTHLTPFWIIVPGKKLSGLWMDGKGTQEC